MSSYLAGLFAEIGIAGIAALGVYVILASGQLSLGNGAFMAIGAYAAGWLTVVAGWPLAGALPAGAALAAGVGALVGFPALRLRGIYLAMATLGFGEMTRSILQAFEPLGGAAGFSGMRRLEVWVIWAWLLGILLALGLLARSRLWLMLRAVHDDEVAANLIGLSGTALKVGAFGTGAALSGLAGGLFAHWHLFIEPGNFGFERSTELVMAVVLGGSTVAAGPVLGAGLLVLLPEWLRVVADWRLAAYGALLVLVLLVRRQGVLDAALFRRRAPGPA
ncbi:branched-chain amino acid ABC transporter permease [Paracraurococcus lichenis]|uniref:Branched-chain amino acid ABC transporter permease n=1 Tax=Paracraurococcus lichenis TaxID=3064888 RepID=A0ABT9E926_9PROT|nr:branched-chain amino acid ABC transporter permease [Paracraurococcus sp. LOR1-02]MDO9712666.1 branched-chain amino acid ABC transporter permease [Paracraurococcus sp. LOR1-02]